MPTVMVVDDTTAARNSISRLLRREGYETICACDGREAMDSLDERTNGGGPDLMLLDVTASELDGLALLEVLQFDPRWRALPVVVLAAEADYHCVRRAEQLGAKHHRVKAAFSVGELLDHVQRYTRRAVG